MLKSNVDYFKRVGVILNKKTYMLLGIIFGVTLLLSAGILVLTNTYKNNRNKEIAEEKETVKKINAGYKTFKEALEKFSDERKKIIDEISDLTNLYSAMESNYKEVTKKIEEYETLVEKIENEQTELNDLCIGKTYYQYEITNKCEAFVSGLEQAINTYVRNLEMFNGRIEEYNKWTTEKENSGHKKIEKIVSKKYPTYVDLNKDKKFEGQVGE